jgi:FHA domain-containing protein
MNMFVMGSVLPATSLQQNITSLSNRVSFQGNQVFVNLADLTTFNPPMQFRIQRGLETPAGYDLIRLEEPSVSRQHAEVIYSPASRYLILKDLGSSNGVFVDGQRIAGPHQGFTVPRDQGAFAFQIGAVQVVLQLPKEAAPAAPSITPGDSRLIPAPSAQPHPVLGKDLATNKPAEPVLIRSTASTPGHGDLNLRFPPGTPDRVVDLVSDYLGRVAHVDRPDHATVNLQINWYTESEFYEDAYVKLIQRRASRFDTREGIITLKGEEGKTVAMDFSGAESGIIGNIRETDLHGTPVMRINFLMPDVSSPQSELGLLTQLQKAFQRVDGYLSDRPELSPLDGIFRV